MENIKGKVITLIGVLISILAFCGIYWLLFYQNTNYYKKIDNTKIEKLDTSYDMNYEYTLTAYNKDGKEKEITFKTSRELKDGAYLEVEFMLTRGVKTWKEIQFNELPDKVQDVYE